MADQPSPDHLSQLLTWSNGIAVAVATGIGAALNAMITKRGDKSVKEIETTPAIEAMWTERVQSLVADLQDERDKARENTSRLEDMVADLGKTVRDQSAKIDKLDAQNRSLLDKLDAVLRHMTLLEGIIRELGGSPPERPHAVRSKKPIPETAHEAR